MFLCGVALAESEWIDKERADHYLRRDLLKEVVKRVIEQYQEFQESQINILTKSNISQIDKTFIKEKKRRVDE